MDRKIQIGMKTLVIGGLLLVAMFGLSVELVYLHRSFDNAKLIFQVQQNAQNIQALDQALGKVMEDMEGLKGR